MKVGFSKKTLMAPTDSPLSGFLHRYEQASEGFHDPIHVRGMLVEDRENQYLLLGYDLLAMGRDVHERVTGAIAAEFPVLQAEKIEIACTHTHSAPPAITLRGCGKVGAEFVDEIVTKTLEAVRKAHETLHEAEMKVWQAQIDDVTYFRRKELDDGTVSMSIEPEGKVIVDGEVDSSFTRVEFSNARGESLGQLLHFAAHPVINGSNQGSAEFPGRLCSKLEKECDAPVMFLQGACANLNPTVVAKDIEHMLNYADDLYEKFMTREKEIVNAKFDTITQSKAQIELEYAPIKDNSDDRKQCDALKGVLAGDLGSKASRESLNLLAGIMNTSVEEMSEEKRVFAARVFHDNHAVTLERESSESTCPLSCGVWRMGPLNLVFVAAEMFVETGRTIRDLYPGQVTLPVAYTAPLVGYLPTTEAMSKGGYEVDQAWRFYDHPAPFAPGSTEKLLNHLQA